MVSTAWCQRRGGRGVVLGTCARNVVPRTWRKGSGAEDAGPRTCGRCEGAERAWWQPDIGISSSMHTTDVRCAPTSTTHADGTLAPTHAHVASSWHSTALKPSALKSTSSISADSCRGKRSGSASTAQERSSAAAERPRPRKPLPPQSADVQISASASRTREAGGAGSEFGGGPHEVEG